MDLDSVADELYGLPLGDFTATRNARAKQARADGDRGLAAEIGQLAKPTTAAWLVNRLARELADQVGPLIDLGRDLREASAGLSGDDLRALSRQRHQVVHALLQQARRLGAADGHRVSDEVLAEVRQSLDASLADPDVAETVLAGRLTRTAEYAGFGLPAGGAPMGGAQPRTPRQSADSGDAVAEVADLTARRREAAERAVAEAETRLTTAREELASVEQDGEQAAAGLREAEQEVERLRGELAAAERGAATAGDTDRAARERVDRARAAAEEAERARDEAQRDVDDLRDTR